VASKTILIKPVKHQISKKMRRPTMSFRATTFVAMLFQVTSPSNNSDWWLDIDATRLVCSNKDLFSTYITPKENVSIADRSTAAVLGI